MSLSYLNIPLRREQPQVHRSALFNDQLLPQHIRVAPRIARHVTSLLRIWQRNQLNRVVRQLEHRAERMQSRVDCATQRRGRDELDAVVVGEVVAEGAALFVAEVG